MQNWCGFLTRRGTSVIRFRSLGPPETGPRLTLGPARNLITILRSRDRPRFTAEVRARTQDGSCVCEALIAASHHKGSIVEDKARPRLQFSPMSRTSEKWSLEKFFRPIIWLQTKMKLILFHLKSKQVPVQSSRNSRLAWIGSYFAARRSKIGSSLSTNWSGHTAPNSVAVIDKTWWDDRPIFY